MEYYRGNGRNYYVVLILGMVLHGVACSRSGDELAAENEQTVDVDWVMYEEQEQGTGQYPVRMLVSEQYLRFDDNFDASDFLLLDRRTHTLFSVSHDDKSILVIDYQAADRSLPPDIVLTTERKEDAEAPKIAGTSPMYIRFLANDELCYEAYVVPGVQEEVAGALTEYLQLLGMRQQNALDDVPETLQTPCFLSRYVYRPARHLQEGLPVREWDSSGYRRTLVDYGGKLPVSRSLFVLPEGYRQFRID